MVSKAEEFLDKNQDEAAMSFIAREVGGAFTVDLDALGGDPI